MDWTGLLEFAKNVVIKVFDAIANAIVSAADLVVNFPTKIRNAIEEFLNQVIGLEVSLPTLNDILIAIGGSVSVVVGWIGKAKDKVADFIKELKPVVNQFLPKFVKGFKSIGTKSIKTHEKKH